MRIAKSKAKPGITYWTNLGDGKPVAVTLSRNKDTNTYMFTYGDGNWCDPTGLHTTKSEVERALGRAKAKSAERPKVQLGGGVHSVPVPPAVPPAPDTVPCGLCQNPTPMKGTRRCDRCWELEKRVQADPAIARRVLCPDPVCCPPSAAPPAAAPYKQAEGRTQPRPRAVYVVTERAVPDGTFRTFWTKVGKAFENRDGSVTLKLDALPLSGMLQIRDEDKDRERFEGVAKDGAL